MTVVSSEVRAIPLNQLRFGHEADPPINARKVGRDEDVSSLQASIEAHGLGQPLNVRASDKLGLAFVADGNRRLLALQNLAADGKIAAKEPISCIIGDAGADADEISLALNLQRVAMHPADQYEKFHELHDRGRSAEQIGARFGIDPVEVRRMIALGRLHPDILEAWRTDELGNQAGSVVKAFTLAPSLEAQKKVLDQLQKGGRLYPGDVRAAFGSSSYDVMRDLTFVGLEAFRAAGGKVTEDLFGEGHIVANPDLLKVCVDKRFADEKAALATKGWGWVAYTDELPQSWTYSYEKPDPATAAEATKEEAAELKKLRKVFGKKPFYDMSPAQRDAHRQVEQIEKTIRARGYTEEERAGLGAVLAMTREGDLSVTYGVKKPKPVAPTAEQKADKPAISDALATRLSEQLTRAAIDALAADPKIALAAIVASLSRAYGRFADPVRLAPEGLFSSLGAAKDEAYSTLFHRLAEMSLPELLEATAKVAGRTVHLQTLTAARRPLADPSYSSFAEALPSGALQAALRERFDAEDYFKSAPKAVCLEAIEEALNADEARKVSTLKKPEIAAFAVANVPPTGWLPAELRTKTYAGPGAKAKRAKKSAEAVEPEAEAA